MGLYDQDIDYSDDEFAFTNQAWWLCWYLKNSCTGLAVMFGAPIFLCGSALYSRHPGDIDLRCLMQREDLEALFGKGCADGDHNPNQMRMHREELKQSRRLHARFSKRNWPRIDFQFQTCLYYEGTYEPIDGRGRIRIDDVPDHVFGAGKGTP